MNIATLKKPLTGIGFTAALLLSILTATSLTAEAQTSARKSDGVCFMTMRGGAKVGVKVEIYWKDISNTLGTAYEVSAVRFHTDVTQKVHRQDRMSPNGQRVWINGLDYDSGWKGGFWQATSGLSKQRFAEPESFGGIWTLPFKAEARLKNHVFPSQCEGEIQMTF